MLFKLILFILMATLIWYKFFNKSSKIDDDTDEENLIECSKCGIYVSVKEAYLSNGSYYCSSECSS